MKNDSFFTGENKAGCIGSHCGVMRMWRTSGLNEISCRTQQPQVGRGMKHINLPQRPNLIPFKAENSDVETSLQPWYGSIVDSGWAFCTNGVQFYPFDFIFRWKMVTAHNISMLTRCPQQQLMSAHPQRLENKHVKYQIEDRCYKNRGCWCMGQTVASKPEKLLSAYE